MKIFWIALAYQENGDSLNDCACIVNVITIHELVDIGKLFPSSRTVFTNNKNSPYSTNLVLSVLKLACCLISDI